MSQFNKATKVLGIIFSLVYLNVGFSAGERVSLMTYNLENLFDTIHDKGKEDWTYLPLSYKRSHPEVIQYCKSLKNKYYRKTCLKLDWSQETFRKKVEQLSKVIRSFDNGKGPDILVVQEVENLNALTQLKNIGLAGMGYQTVVVLEGPDKRGIDVGLISRFPLAEPPKIHIVDLSEVDPSEGYFSKKTRGILEVTLQIGESKVTVFGNHWSSQGNIDQARMVAAKTLYKAVLSQKNHPVIATGDFNTLPDDSPHGINEYLLDDARAVSFLDSEKERVGEGQWPHLPAGSHWYRGHWNSLDRIFVLKSAVDRREQCQIKNCLEVDWSSFDFYRPEFILRTLTIYNPDEREEVTYDNVPWRFDPKTGEGYSDHAPVVVKFQL